MTEEHILTVTNAFDPQQLLAGFIAFAPFILTVAGILVGISIINWGLKHIRLNLSDGFGETYDRSLGGYIRDKTVGRYHEWQIDRNNKKLDRGL